MSTPQKLNPVGALKQQEVLCPHCQATQMEPLGVISTNCRSCGNYFRLSESRPAPKLSSTPKATQGIVREVTCVKCRTPNRVSDAAMSTQCVRCSNYLDLRDVVIRGASSERVHTYGELSFAPGSAFRGFSAEATKIEIFGKVFSKLDSHTEMVIGSGAQVSGEIKSPKLEVQRGSTVKVQTISCAHLFIEGEVEIFGPLDAEEIIVQNHGKLKAQTIRVKNIRVDEGCALEGELETVRD